MLVVGGQLAAVPQRRQHRVGHRDRAEVALLDLAPQVEAGGPGQVRVRLGGTGPRARRAGRWRPRPSSTRARPGGTPPHRSGGRTGRGCAAPAGRCWPAGPSPGPRRCPRVRPARPAVEAPSASQAGVLAQAAQSAVGAEQVDAGPRPGTLKTSWVGPGGRGYPPVAEPGRAGCQAAGGAARPAVAARETGGQLSEDQVTVTACCAAAGVGDLDLLPGAWLRTAAISASAVVTRWPSPR